MTGSDKDFSIASSISCSSDFFTGSANDSAIALVMSSSSVFMTGSDKDSTNTVLIIFLSSSLRTFLCLDSSLNASLLALRAYAKASSSGLVSVVAFLVSFKDASMPACMCSILASLDDGPP